MPPIGFDDDEMNALTALASSMPPAARDDFVRLVAGKLAALLGSSGLRAIIIDPGRSRGDARGRL